MSSLGKSNSQNVENPKKHDTIKYGLISQEKSCINVYDLINSYFTNSKPNKYLLKDEFHYEFSPSMFPHLTITINNLRKIENIYTKYNQFNFFLILIDIQTSCIDFLDKAVDAIIDAGDNNYNKKSYVLGFFEDNNKISNPKDRITTIIDAKGIEYYYFELKIDDIESVCKVMEGIISDSNTIMVEKFLDQKHSELGLDNSKSQSHCSIF